MKEISDFLLQQLPPAASRQFPAAIAPAAAPATTQLVHFSPAAAPPAAATASAVSPDYPGSSPAWVMMSQAQRTAFFEQQVCH